MGLCITASRKLLMLNPMRSRPIVRCMETKLVDDQRRTAPQDFRMDTPSRPGAHWRSSRMVGLWAAVLLVALVYRLHGLHQNLLYDHLAYAQYAYDMKEGTFSLTDNYAFAHRLPVIAPAALAYAWLGFNPLSTMLWPFLLSLLQIAMIIVLGSRLFDRPTGLIAGLFMAMMPMDVTYAGIPGADGVLAAFLTGAVGFWLLGTESPRPPRRMLLLLSGACFVVAAMTRLYAVILGLFFLVHLLWVRPPRSSAVWAGLGALLIGVPILLLYRIETGNALYALAIQSDTFGRRILPPPFDPLFYPRNVWNPRSPTGLFGLLFMGAALIGLWRPNRARQLLFLWVLPLFLFLQFGSMNFSTYRPVYKEVRYLSPLFGPLAILAASVTMQVISWPWVVRLFHPWQLGPRRIRGILIGLMLAVFALHSWYAVGQIRDRHERISGSFKSAVALLRRTPSLPIYFDHWRTGLAFSYYFDFEQGSRFYHDADDSLRIGRPGSFGDSRFGYLPWYRDPAMIPPGFIVLDDEVLKAARQAGSPPASYLGVVVPAYCFNPPAAWEPVLRAGRLRVFLNPASDSSLRSPTATP
jgi:4-amino-4-deoxy-L-arabinose transferase-like glycosyltransferase